MTLYSGRAGLQRVGLGWLWLSLTLLTAVGAGADTNGGDQALDRPTPFISVTPDDDYVAADAMLSRYLRRVVNLEIRRKATYQNAIEEVVRQSAAGTPYIARLTPYPCVVAALEGAKFEIIATYVSRATGGLTYHSYFVVKETKQQPPFDFPPEPTTRDLVDFLRQQRRSFNFHDKFSTSSYFMPLHFFHSQGIFDLEPGPHGRLIPIGIDRLALPDATEPSSSDLVRAVEAGTTDVAAVWDGTKAKLAGEFPNLRFVRLEAALPNDLLVASSALGDAKIQQLREAVRQLRCGSDQFPGAGDFKCWKAMDDAPEAREALASLRRLAVAQPAPVTIRITAASSAEAAALEAARQAVRLAGTEFVLFDPDFHRAADVDWKLKLIHDGALELTSVVNEVDAKKVEPQVFSISFADAQEELTKRIVSLLLTRVNRIRYLWAFENRVPTIIRDVGFALPEGSRVTVQKITWIDRDRNEFIPGDEFLARVTLADFYKFQLEREDFPREDELLDPMSNAAYRVVLVRPSTDRPLFRYLTLSLVVLFVLAGGVAAKSLYRPRSTRATAPASSRQAFAE